MTNFFPKIDDVSEECVCKKKDIIIEDENGTFYGSVERATDLPFGYGIFVAGDWIRCGGFDGSRFADSNSVSVNKSTKEMIIADTKILAQGSKL